MGDEKSQVKAPAPAPAEEPKPLPPRKPLLPKSFKFKPYKEASERVVASAKLGDLVGDDPDYEPPPIKTGGFSDTRNDINADGKYLLLAVPEWKPGMSSYLR